VIKAWNGCITISAVYSLSKHVIKNDKYITFLQSLSNRFITVGDYNAKHWGLRLTLSKGQELFKAIDAMNLTILSIDESTGQLIAKRSAGL